MAHTALLLRINTSYGAGCALVCERLRCEPWRFTEKHKPRTQDAQAQTVEKGETATTVRSQRWGSQEGECDDGPGKVPVGQGTRVRAGIDVGERMAHALDRVNLMAVLAAATPGVGASGAAP